MALENKTPIYKNLNESKAGIKDAKRPLVLVGGTFDILHIGHKRYFEVAKDMGKSLIVHIVGDRRVKERKGVLRPINKETDRAELVAGLKPVDFVFTYNGCTYSEEVINAIKPDIFIFTSENDKRHKEWKKKLERKFSFLSVKVIPNLTENFSTSKIEATQRNKLLESFRVIKGFTWDLYYSGEVLEFGFEGGRSEFLSKIADKITEYFSNEAEDIIVYGSIAYRGVHSNSDVDLIGINRKNRKNKKYFFKVKNKAEIIDVTVRIDCGKNYYHTRFCFKEWPKSPEGYVNNKWLKCWGFIPSKTFSKDSLMNKIASLDSIECLAGILQTMLYKGKSTEIIIKPEEVADEVKNQFRGTRQKRLFGYRWENGLRNNCIDAMRESLSYCDFWAKEIENGKYVVKEQNGLKPRKRAFSSLYVFMQKLTPMYLGYELDKKRFSRIIPELYSKDR